MRVFNNIEKSAFHGGTYVGYAAGLVYRIRKGPRGWTAANQAGGDSFTHKTLVEISAALETTAAYMLDQRA